MALASERSAPTRSRRPPRTQEQRSAETRARIIAAATECIAELGLRGATMGAIGERAGVSWGAIQHQFGEKGVLLDAVLEGAIEDVRQNLSGIAEIHPAPAERLAVFVRRCGELLRSPVYRAFFEIQLDRGRDRGPQDRAWSRFIEEVLAEIWLDLFGDLELSREQLEDTQRFTFAVLGGIAAETMLFPEASFTSRHFEILEQTLLHQFGLETPGQREGALPDRR